VREDILRFLREPATFIASASEPALWLRGLDDFAIASIERHDDRTLRPAQEGAWRGLADRRAGLILGPPGTGKTHLLSWIITGVSAARRAVDRPARVLVTAFTRNAIGNLLDAVAARRAVHDPDAGAPIFFGGAPDAGLSAGVDKLGRPDTPALLQRLSSGQAVVGTTVWSLYRLLTENSLPDGDGMTAPLFDLICIDEASQMVLGHGLMALAGLADGGRVVVAGDDRQLPPIRAGRPVPLDGRELGGSLYAFLKSVGAPEYSLDETFRLNEPLTRFPERTFYPGRYVSRSEAELELRPDWRDGLDPLSRAALDPDLPLVILLHNGPTAATSNPFEAQVAARLAGALAERMADGGGIPADLWAERLAVVSPHRAQNGAIRAALPDAIRPGAFVETVDRIQGKERQCVILSYCVADPEFALTEAEFIFSPERLNVASTRASSKLIVIVSRRLLEAVPSEQEVLDKAELLREFVFSCPEIGVTEAEDPFGRPVSVEIRGRAFAERELDIDLTAEPIEAAPRPELTDRASGVLEAIRRLASQNQYGSAILTDVAREMALTDPPFADAKLLHELGWISLQQRRGRFGPFWTAYPFSEQRTVWSIDEETVRARIDIAIREARRGRHAFYDPLVRDRFAWMADTGQDLLMPVLRRLEDEGIVEFGTAGQAVTIAMRAAREAPPEPLPTAPDLTDEDFLVLNRLEELEADRINFGVFDGWTSRLDLTRRTRLLPDQLAASLSRLAEQGHLLIAAEGRIRSRIAELARELRHVKQRFKRDDAHRRPYLVRSLKLELQDRNKPQPSVSLADAFAMAGRIATPQQQPALAGVERMLRRHWGDDAMLAAFQVEGLTQVLAAWNGGGPTRLAIAADTGSGKTEAAALPIIAAALSEAAGGVRGTRAIFTYPRVRLAANQAQRLAGYLAALSHEEDLPPITLGLQVADVPPSFDGMSDYYREAWPAAGPNALGFPFFGCPACSARLILRPGEGWAEADSLQCRECGWRFDGWIGSKAGLREHPPSLFLPTTESLHQWLHNGNYARLFGDDPRFPPPRALLADEIHLYTHVHGAQVGLALRRLAARAQLNDAEAREMVAIGMSATVADPAQAWGRLIGHSDVQVIEPAPGDRVTNPKGREYCFFLQPEVESRGADIAGASTTIQALMCLAHGTRRRTGREGGFRSLVFFDSIDKMRRLHSSYVDAEQGLELATYRTADYGDGADGEPLRNCCGEPIGCDRFADGECWWFAAQDGRQCGAVGLRRPGEPLRVADRPIFSGTGGDAERLVKGADIVFATSSLEVGYDDPDITLVYQHYAPLNLASFVQRKGRGGRGADDRPTTAVTLSIYSPRDSWYFRRPREMISPSSYDTPLNPDNFFVRRGQALAALLDGMARAEARGERVLGPSGRPLRSAVEAAGPLVEAVLGERIWAELDVEGPAGLWQAAVACADLSGCRYLSDFRERLDWVPNTLFETINLPVLRIEGQEVYGGAREDISLAMPTIAPGNAMRRFSSNWVHWVRPMQGSAPWLPATDYSEAEFQPLRPNEAALLQELPVDARPALAGIHTDLCRPRRATVERLGRMDGARWTGMIGHRASRTPSLGEYDASTDRIAVRHDSRGELDGFLLVTAAPDAGASLPTGPLAPVVPEAIVFRAGLSRETTSGLDVAQVYWGADAEVRFDDRATEPEAYTQLFVHPSTRRPLLHGYQVSTEGVRLRISSERLNEAVTDAQARMEADEAERKWRSAQFLRYLIESRARAAGVNAYQAKQGADLIVAASGDEELRAELNRLRRFWSAEALASLFDETRLRVLAQQPTMTAARVGRTAEALAADSFQVLLNEAIDEVRNAERMTGYLRSTILHGLALRMRTWLALAGSGDEGRLFAHVRLPIQFGVDAEDVITIAEAGSHGDGTIRAVADRWTEALDAAATGFLRACPNAEEDAALRRFWALAGRHVNWRAADPRDPAALGAIAAEISPETGDQPLPAAIARILFDVASVGAESFSLYDLAANLEQVRHNLSSRMGRSPSDWELVTAAVTEASAGSAIELARLREAYGALGESTEEAFSPDARLADQAYRIAAPLCHDGCRACVYQASDLMGDSLVQASTSRTLLQHFLG
jgi:hypothetical protein